MSRGLGDVYKRQVAATLIGVILYKETLSAGEIFGIRMLNETAIS